MTVTFPMTMPIVGVMTSSFELERVDFAAPEAGGTLGGVQAGFPRWLMRLGLNSMVPPVFEAWRAWLALQRGSQRSFVAFDPARRFPRAYQYGGSYTATASAWSQSIAASGLAALTLTGLTAGQEISIGDYVGFAWASATKRTIARACESATADGAGLASFAVEPPLPYFVPTVGGGCVVSLANASCLMKLVPGDTRLAEVAIGYMEAGGTVSAAQDLRP